MQLYIVSVYIHFVNTMYVNLLIEINKKWIRHEKKKLSDQPDVYVLFCSHNCML